MAVNKNFIIRNGLEVDENLIFADANTQKVGIGSTTPECELTVAGKICGDRAEFSGIVTASGFFQGAILSTDIDANNLDVTGISTFNNVEINGLLTAGGTTGQANYYLANTGAGITWKSFQENVVNSVTFTATEGQSLFTLDYEIGLIEVYLNGVRLTNSEFSALNGSTVTLLDPAFDGDTVDFVTYSNAFDFLQLGEININTTGIITASSFVGDGSGLTNVIGTGSGIGVQDDGSNVGTAQTINFGSNLAVSAISSGLVTVTASGGGGIGTDGSINTTGIITASKLHVDSVGSGITFAEDLVVQGDARVTGILSIGTSSIVLDSNAKVIRGVDEVHIGTSNTVVLKQKTTGEIEFAHSDGTEASVGIGSTADINTTGIITASSFVGDGSLLTNVSGGTTLPSAADGEALIYENGQWVAGPVIGGVSYASAADPEYSNVQLLLHFNGADGSTTFTDSSSNGLTVNVGNNSQISTTQSKFGGASGYFDGTDDTISASSSLLRPLTGPFTLELWYYALALDGGLVNTGNTTGAYELALFSTDLRFYTNASGTVLTATPPSLNAWHHIAVTRDSSNNLRLFVDGALVDSTTNTDSLNKNNFIISTSRTGFYDFEGYIDDLRLTTGVARYTAAFTPPTTQLAGAGSPVTIPYSIDKLDDVDTSTVAPTDGQALVWDNANSQWEPVSLGIEDLDDFLLQATPPVSAYNAAKQADGDFSNTGSTAGGYALNPSGGNYTGIYINKNNPTSGTSLASQGFTAGTNLDLWVSADGVTFTQHTATNSYNQGGNNAQFAGLSPNLNAYTSASALYFSLTSAAGTPIALADGDILQYESATSKFRPVQAAGVRSLLGIEEYVDDTAAGTGGLSSGEMYYNTTSSSYVLKS